MHLHEFSSDLSQTVGIIDRNRIPQFSLQFASLHSCAHSSVLRVTVEELMDALMVVLAGLRVELVAGAARAMAATMKPVVFMVRFIYKRKIFVSITAYCHRRKGRSRKGEEDG